jgi:uncharacterized protein YjiS (DUF1127 family)
MAKHNITQTRPSRTARGTFLDRPLERLLALVHEWRTRRNIVRSLGHLSNMHLSDVGLTKVDIEAACADSFNRSASRALKSAVQNRMGNWRDGKASVHGAHLDLP